MELETCEFVMQDGRACYCLAQEFLRLDRDGKMIAACTYHGSLYKELTGFSCIEVSLGDYLAWKVMHG